MTGRASANRNGSCAASRAESETIGASNLARQVATTQTEEDPIDRIGTRIGRGLGIVVALGLLVYLYVTYFRRIDMAGHGLCEGHLWS